MKIKGSPTKMSGLWVEASGRKPRVGVKSIRGRPKAVGNRSGGGGLGKRAKGRPVSVETTNPLEEVTPASDSSDRILSDDMETHSSNATEEGSSEYYKDEQQTENRSRLFGDLPKESVTGVGTNTDSGRNAECIDGKSKAATSGRSYGSSVVNEATAEGIDLTRKVVASSGQARPKRPKNLGDIVAKLRTVNEKCLQHDSNDSN